MKAIILVLCFFILVYGEINHWLTTKRLAKLDTQLEIMEARIDQIKCK